MIESAHFTKSVAELINMNSSITEYMICKVKVELKKIAVRPITNYTIHTESKAGMVTFWGTSKN
jgi:hypothetical protein